MSRVYLTAVVISGLFTLGGSAQAASATVGVALNNGIQLHLSVSGSPLTGGGFATNGVNMIKLESYMENGSFTATFFYVEVEGRPEDRGVARAFEELQFFSEKFEVLGVYPADPFRTRG